MTSAHGLPHWNLDGFFPEGKIDIYQALKVLEERFVKFGQVRKSLEGHEPLPAADFLKFLDQLEEIHREAQLLAGYASLNFAQDTSDQKVQSLMFKVDSVMAELENEVLFFSLWWKDLPDEQAAPLLEAAPRHRYMLTRERDLKKHTLTEAEEKIINLKDLTGCDFLTRLYDTITNAYLYRAEFLPPDQKRDLTREELMNYVRHHRPEYRAGAYQELYRVYGQAQATLGQIYQSLTQDWYYEEVVLRHHASPIASRNKQNDLKDETVESLLRVCQQKAPEVFGRYFKVKAQRLGIPTLRRYDIYAPLKPATKTYTFDQALKEVDQAFRAFDSEFADLALRVSKSNRLSALISPGKQSGAFCSSTIPGETPWVLMNYQGHQHDLFTLAHELGHAVHSLLASNLSLFEFHSALPMAETASTFGEMLLTEHFRKNCDQSDIESLSFSLLDDAYATVGRQAFFSLFELEAHEMTNQGATVDELSKAYSQNLQKQFGDSVLVAPEFCHEWASIPHFFHTPFYVYAYAFGQLLVYSLWNLYQNEGPSFVPKMKAILAKGGSASPEEILRQANLGPLDDHFWLGGFKVIESFIPKD
ncbi:MAG: M3 family oligoendopeptidase [Deltaproteobacteria bacterium]|jgi:oligoendopeptidase F|nr:M3 family oligoendopeptidase [Deltaproteobacteria bacterium]